MTLFFAMENLDEIANGVNSYTPQQPLSNYKISQLNMIMSRVSINTQSHEFESKIKFDENFETNSSQLRPTVVIDIEEDGNAFVAYSASYYNYFGVGRTKKDAVKAFKKIFNDKKDGENLIDVMFIESSEFD